MADTGTLVATGRPFGLFYCYRLYAAQLNHRPVDMDEPLTIKLKVPDQDLSVLSLFQTTTDGAQNWAQSLPANNTNALVELLNQSLNDLTRTKLLPELRYNILEILLPSLEVALANLSKRFLNQPLIMPEEPQRMVGLSGELISAATTAYTIVAIEAMQQSDTIRETNPALLTCEAIHRALMFAGRRILQSFQLHLPVKIHSWQTLHQLYLLAQSQQLVSLPIPEPLSGGSTIKATYLQTVMLSCCKPNQLRQSDLAALYQRLREWSALLELKNPGDGDELFLVDLDSDRQPVYSAMIRTRPGPRCFHINTTGLVEHLEGLKKLGANNEEGSFDSSDSVSSGLLDHLISALGSMSLRNFKRSASDRILRICLGLSSTHYHVAGERVFEDLFFSEATRTNLLDDDPDLPPYDRYPVFQVQLADTSPNGYCLEWLEEFPGNVRASDIVGLKENNEQELWSIAVIRWLSRLDNATTLIGIELLSPHAVAYGASIHRKEGANTAPMRALLLPEIKLVGQAQTIITPRAGFKERQKVTLRNKSEVHTIQLLRQLSSTAGFERFEFRYIKELGEVLAESPSRRSEYDSLWSNI